MGLRPVAHCDRTGSAHSVDSATIGAVGNYTAIREKTGAIFSRICAVVAVGYCSTCATNSTTATTATTGSVATAFALPGFTFCGVSRSGYSSIGQSSG